MKKRQVHLDFHTSEYIENIGEHFDKDTFALTLKNAHVNSITCFARCHHGWLYYPSKLQPNMVHPHLKNKNLLLEQIEACHAQGIDVPVYTTVQWDGYIANTHPEWLCRNGKGEYINSQGVEEPHFYYSLCLNSGYRDYFKKHLLDIIEVVGKEKLDGIFMDILFRVDCDCEHCQKEMTKKGIDHTTEINRLYYSEMMLAEFKKEITELIHKHVPKAGVFYNGSHIGYADKRNLASYSHLELESLPSGGWGYDHFPITMRYARKLGKDIIGMTGKFHTYWGDFHSLKNKTALEFECFNMLALGAGCSIGDQLHPDGKLSDAAYKLIGDIYEVVEKVEAVCEKNGHPVTEIAVLTPEETWVAGGHSLRLAPSLIGANRMLQELNYQFDIIDSEMDFSDYRVIILPDVIEYTQLLFDKLTLFVEQGGHVIGSYKSLLNEENSMNELYGIEFLGDSEYDIDFILPNNEIGKKLPKEEFVMYLQGAKVKNIDGEKVLDSVQAYFNRTGKTFCSHQHAPSSRKVGSPAGIRKGRVMYFSHPIFNIYRKNAANWVKEIVKDILEEFIPNKLLKHNGPTTLLTTVNQSADKETHLIHALHYITQKNSEDIYTINEIIELNNITLEYYVGNKTVKKVTDIRNEQELSYQKIGEYVVITLNNLEGYDLIEVVTD